MPLGEPVEPQDLRAASRRAICHHLQDVYLAAKRTHPSPTRQRPAMRRQSHPPLTKTANYDIRDVAIQKNVSLG
jgi:hypothetical protein